MLPEQPAARYRAYLLRLWRAGGGWRASQIDPHTSQQRAFPGLEALFAFLTSLTQDPPELAARPAGEPPALERAKGLDQPGSAAGTAATTSQGERP